MFIYIYIYKTYNIYILRYLKYFSKRITLAADYLLFCMIFKKA